MLYRLHIKTKSTESSVNYRQFENEFAFWKNFIKGYPSALKRSFTCREVLTGSLQTFYNAFAFIDYSSVHIEISIRFIPTINMDKLPTFLNRFKTITYEIDESCLIIKNGKFPLPSPIFISLLLFLVVYLGDHLDETPDTIITLLLTKHFPMFSKFPKGQIFNAFYLFYCISYVFGFTEQNNGDGPATAGERKYLSSISLYKMFYGRYKALIDDLINKSSDSKTEYKNILWDIESKEMSPIILDILEGRKIAW